MKPTKSDNILKILSLLIAIVLWFYVVQVQSPDIEKVYKNVPIVFTQRSVLEGKGLTILNDKERTMDIKIKGKRKHLVDTSPENITVVADLSTIEETGVHTVFTSIILPYGNLEVLSKNPSTLSVNVDELMEKTFDVSLKTIGTPKGSYVVGDILPAPKPIKIRGPKTIINGINSVTASIDVSDKDSDVTVVAPLLVFDSNAKEIDKSYLSLSAEEIQVRCEILKTKTIEVAAIFSQEILNSDVSYTPDKNSLSNIRVKGAADTLDKLNIVETMPIKPKDIDSLGNATVRLNLPEGVRSIDGDSFVIRLTKNTPTAVE